MPSTEQIVKTYETIYLLKWLFPDTAVKQYRTAVKKTRRFNRFQD